MVIIVSNFQVSVHLIDILNARYGSRAWNATKRHTHGLARRTKLAQRCRELVGLAGLTKREDWVGWRDYSIPPRFGPTVKIVIERKPPQYFSPRRIGSDGLESAELVETFCPGIFVPHIRMPSCADDSLLERGRQLFLCVAEAEVANPGRAEYYAQFRVRRKQLLEQRHVLE
jgi:hypothetical protein